MTIKDGINLGIGIWICNLFAGIVWWCIHLVVDGSLAAAGMIIVTLIVAAMLGFVFYDTRSENHS
jgi:hypothetical protein